MGKITVEQILDLMDNPDTILIEENGQTIFAGYLATFQHHSAEYEAVKDKPVKHVGIRTDISHKRWKELGLLSPIEPDRLPEYSFSDLQLTIYRLVVIGKDEDRDEQTAMVDLREQTND